MRRLRLATLLVLVVALAAPSLAAASSTDVIKDCQDGALSKTYSHSDLSHALSHLPADVDEYTDCRDVIRRALLGGGTGGTGAGGAGGTGAGGAAGVAGGTGGGDVGGGTGAGGIPDPLATATPEERASYAKAVQAGAAPVVLDGRPITPGTLGGAEGTKLTDLPTALLVVLALLALAAIGGAGLGTRRLVLDRRPA
jgi:hypothetical protein